MSQKIRGNKRGKTDLEVAEIAEKKGFPYTAEYIRRYGVDAWNPSFLNGLDSDAETFYKKCVEQNKMWNEV